MTTTTSTHDVISSDRVEGTTVYNTAGEKLGTIDDRQVACHLYAHNGAQPTEPL